jgi:hypothetical protein
MAPFDPETDLSQDRACYLLINTSVTLFWRPQVLDETTAWLSVHGYQVAGIDASHWATERDLHRDMAAALSFPDYYGRNLNGLNDCIRDVVSQDYGWAPDTTGLALAFTGYDSFTARCPRAARIVTSWLTIPAAQPSSAGASCAWCRATIRASALNLSARRPSCGMTPNGSTLSIYLSSPGGRAHPKAPLRPAAIT